MKRLAVSVLAILMIGIASQAQQKSDTSGIKHHQKHHGKQGKHGKHGKDFSKELNLTEDQQAQMKTIREESKKQMAELKKNDNITVKEYRTRMKAIHEQQSSKTQSLLTAGQKQKMEQRKQKGDRGDRMKGDKVRAGRKIDQEKIKSQLGLTDEQSARLKAAHTEMAAKAKAIREDKSLSQEQRKTQMKALAQQQQEQTKSILTREQLEKLEALKSQYQHKSAR